MNRIISISKINIKKLKKKSQGYTMKIKVDMGTEE